MWIFDGAMGTMLQQAGIPEGVCPEWLNIGSPETIRQVHEAYLQAGSDIITTNTFGACGIKLMDFNLSDRVRDINIAAVQLAREAIANVKPGAAIAGSMGPTGTFIAPLGEMQFDDIYETYYEQAQALVAAGVDFILIETMIDIQEIRAALLAAIDAREAAGKTKDEVQIICQFSFSEDGRTVTGTPPEVAAIVVEAMGADIVGMNCSVGPEQMLPLVRRMAAVTNLPISVQPNAGMPKLIGKETVFPLSPEEMGAYVSPLAAAGATYIGACCGSTPAHIAQIATMAKEVALAPRESVAPVTRLTSRTRMVCLGADYPPVMIGERINPTGRKQMAADIAQGVWTTVKKEALRQVEAGADILDVNMGVPRIDQAAVMKTAISELSMLVEVPLSIDTVDPKAMEAALKIYPGRALVNSVNADGEHLAAVLPIVKRYGAAVLALPLGQGSLPSTATARLDLAKQIVARAKAFGLRHEDLLLDPLVLTLAANEQSAIETLKTLDCFREHFGFPTVMGLSNISFGLPQRPYLNAQFLMMALAHGLNAPILNPLDKTVQKAFVAGCSLLGWDPAAGRFITCYGNEVEPVVSSTRQTMTETESEDTADLVTRIGKAVEKGEKEVVVSMVEAALASGIDPLEITDKGLSAAMNRVGDRFGAGTMFLPQVLLAAETMQAAFGVIKRGLPEATKWNKGTVVMATVKGDIHDLGKNIVSALLENNGYRVIDLGKDVDPEKIVHAAQTEKADIIGICSLMTTTLPMVDTTIEAIHTAKLESRVIVGGAVMTSTYATQAGADGYAKDGVAAVHLVGQLLAAKG